VEPSQGFPPISRLDARLLILGSLPGQRSIAEQQYYAHPQNAFWRIMRDVLGIDGDYEQRCEGLRSKQVAVWDVLRASVRPGSMDADIRVASSEANDFQEFLDKHQHVTRVLCNGRKAANMFERLVLPSLDAAPGVVCLPSTSPAFAAMRYDTKLRIWRDALTLCCGS
jgi:hypoxanthine-DNA glycosylase